MGFALWRQDELAICAGTHEYRPMGAAVIHVNGVFTARDFSAQRKALTRGRDGFVGYFASLAEVNAHLAKRESTQKRNSHRILSTF